MKFEITISENFKKKFKTLLKKYPSLKEDLSRFQQELQKNPVLGDSLGSNCYKVRMAIASKGKGKSGGARIISYVLV